MAAALTARRGDKATGNIQAGREVVHIEVTGAVANLAAGTEKRYYILADAPAGVDDLRSQVFQPASDGSFTWDDFIFSAAGAWVLRLRDVLDDSDVATHAYTIAA